MLLTVKLSPAFNTVLLPPFVQVILGGGFPVALQKRVILLPSIATELEDELVIAAGSIRRNDEKQF